MTFDRYALTEDLLKRLTASAADRLMPGFAIEDLTDGQVLMREGDPGSSLFLVLDGEVLVTHQLERDRMEVLDVVGPGGLVGEMSFIDAQPRSATVKGVGQARLLRLERRHFDQLMKTAPYSALEIMGTLLAVLSARVREANATMVDLHETGRRLAMTATISEVCEVVLQRLSTAVPPAHAGVVAVFEPSGCQPVVAFGLPPGLPAPFPVPVDGDVVRALRARVGAVVIGPGDPLAPAIAFLRQRWCVLTELGHDQQVLGLVAAGCNEGERPFSTQHQVALAILANQAAPALARAQGRSTSP